MALLRKLPSPRDSHGAGCDNGLIARVFYRHALFCASHPLKMIALTGVVVLSCSLPLLTMLGMASQEPKLFHSPDCFPSSSSRESASTRPSHGRRFIFSELFGAKGKARTPKWLQSPPFLAVQQFVLSWPPSFTPYNWASLVLSDNTAVSDNAPLRTVFDFAHNITAVLTELLAEADDKHKNSRVIGSCLAVGDEGGSDVLRQILPSHGCMIIGPDVLKAISVFRRLKQSESLSTHMWKAVAMSDELWISAVKDVVVKDGIALSASESKSHLVVTAFIDGRSSQLESFPSRLVDALKRDSRVGVLHPPPEDANCVHAYYKVEFFGFNVKSSLAVTYICLFLYITFTVGKIRLVKSKWGLGFTAVLTTVFSLVLSVSICMRFGLSPSVNAWEIFPFIMALVGMENTLLIIKSVVSTPVHFAVEKRVALGLQKESNKITNTLGTEFFLLLVGLLSFNSSIQEFCLFATIGVLSDFMLQMVFFTSVLSIDIRRMDLLPWEEPKSPPSSKRVSRCGSSPQVSSSSDGEDEPEQEIEVRRTTRLRFASFIASYRILQSIVIVSTIGYFFFFARNPTVPQPTPVRCKFPPCASQSSKSQELHQDVPPLASSTAKSNHKASVEEAKLVDWLDVGMLRAQVNERVRHLSQKSWPVVLDHYGASVVGWHITVFPPVILSLSSYHTKALDFEESSPSVKLHRSSLQYTDSLKGSVVLVAFVAVLLIWLIVVCQSRCWRRYLRMPHWPYRLRTVQKHNLDGMLLTLMGHLQSVECVAVDGPEVVSCSMDGVLRLWDSVTGECRAIMSLRKRSTPDPPSSSRYTSKASLLSVKPTVSPKARSRQATLGSADSNNDQLAVSLLMRTPDRSSSKGYPFVDYLDTLDQLTSPWLVDQCCHKPEESDVESDTSDEEVPAVWCVAIASSLVVIGCGDGQVQVWDGLSQRHCCTYSNHKSPVTAISYMSHFSRIVAARQTGAIDFLTLSRRSPSSSSLPSAAPLLPHFVSLALLQTVQAHHLPVSCLRCSDNVAMTSSHDRSIKVFDVRNTMCLYTLQGHGAGVTALALDKITAKSPGAHLFAVSGGLDGSLCTWSPLNNSRLSCHKHAHEAAVQSIDCRHGWIVSSGLDGWVCVWTRDSGHRLYRIEQPISQCPDPVILSSVMFACASTTSVVLHRITNGAVLREIIFDDNQTDIAANRHLLPCDDFRLICSYGKHLKVLHFPTNQAVKGE